MKKTLFLSAILGAALCSSEFATTDTITQSSDQVNLQDYVAGDTITMEVTGGYLKDPTNNGTVTYAADLIINNMKFNDGFSRDNSHYVFTGTITGSGEITNTKTSLNGQSYEFSGDMSGYTGTITMGCGNAESSKTSRIVLNNNSVGAATIKVTNSNAVFATEGSVSLNVTLTIGEGSTVSLGTAYNAPLEANGHVLLFQNVTEILSDLSTVAVTGDFVGGHLYFVQNTQTGKYDVYATPEPATATRG